MNSKELQLEIERYVDNYETAWNSFNLYKAIKCFVSKYNKEIQSISFFVNTILISLQTTFLLEICKLIDERNDKNIYKLLNICSQNTKVFLNSDISKDIKRIKDELNNYKLIVENIKAMRDKYYSHADKKYFNNIKLLFKEYNIKYKDIEELFETIHNVFDILSTDLCGTQYYFNDEYIADFEKILKYFKN